MASPKRGRAAALAQMQEKQIIGGGGVADVAPSAATGSAAAAGVAPEIRNTGFEGTGQAMVESQQSPLNEAGLCKLLSTLLPGVTIFPKIDPHLDEVGKATALNLRAFHSCTLQRSRCFHIAHTIEKEIEQLSTPDVQLRACIFPGQGFASYGGFIDSEYDEFLQDSVLVFVFGFNDRYYGYTEYNRKWVFEQVDMHVNFYKSKGCKLVFTQLNDCHGNSLPWLDAYFQQLAEKDPDNVMFVSSIPMDGEASGLALRWPDSGWASEHNQRDNFHLSKSGLEGWLASTLKDFSFNLARELGLGKLMWLTDSSFQANDYPVNMVERVIVFVHHLSGCVQELDLCASETIGDLKVKIAEGLPANTPREFGLRWSGSLLQDESTIQSYNMSDGEAIFVTPNPKDGVESTNYFVSNLFFHKRMDRAHVHGEPSQQSCGGQNYDVPCSGEYEIALGVVGRFDYGDCTWLTAGDGPGVWAISYHGAGLKSGRTMAEHCFESCKGVPSKETCIYSTPDLDHAFDYSDAFEHEGRVFRAVLKNRVNPANLMKLTSANTLREYWIVQDPAEIRPAAILLREESPFSEEEVAEASNHFAQFDESGNSNGVLDQKELLNLLNSLSPSAHERHQAMSENILRRMDADGDKQLSFEELKVWFILQQRKVSRVSRAKSAPAFSPRLAALGERTTTC